MSKIETCQDRRGTDYVCTAADVYSDLGNSASVSRLQLHELGMHVALSGNDVTPASHRFVREVIMGKGTWSGLIGAVLCLGSTAVVSADDVLTYGCEAAPQEIQLFWLADTARVCGWASVRKAAGAEYRQSNGASLY